jgi:glycerate kinase
MPIRRIAVAPNAFRGSLTATEAAARMAAGLRASALNASDGMLEVSLMPLADGGDGTLDVLLTGLGGTHLSETVSGPLGEPVQAEFGALADGETAIIEMARASGVELLPRARRDPLRASTYGTGQLIDSALRRGCRRILLGIGGSATVDGGAGCLSALGVRLLDANDAEIPPGGGGLARLAKIDVASVESLRERLRGVEIIILCDVTNPLIGPNGAAVVFGPQKGADDSAVNTLDANLTRFGEMITAALGVAVDGVPGAGAAGGLSAGLMAFAGARLRPGGDALIALLGYETRLAQTDLVVTGEGKLDAQTEGGKAVQRIAEAAARAGVPVVALAGVVTAERTALRGMGIRAAWGIAPGPCTLDEAIRNAPIWLEQAAARLGDTLALADEN